MKITSCIQSSIFFFVPISICTYRSQPVFISLFSSPLSPHIHVIPYQVWPSFYGYLSSRFYLSYSPLPFSRFGYHLNSFKYLDWVFVTLTARIYILRTEPRVRRLSGTNTGHGSISVVEIQSLVQYISLHMQI